MADLRIWRRRGRGRDGSPPARRQATVGLSSASLDVFVWLTLFSILLFASAARLYNLNWDEDTHLHPDERFVTSVVADIDLPSTPWGYFDGEDSPLNPYNKGKGSFVYGSLPVFLTKLVVVVAGRDNFDDITLVGRALSALFSAGTVLFAFLLGRRLYGAPAGLLAAALLALTPLAIQHAHFFVVDSFLTFFVAASLYFAVVHAGEGSGRSLALAGLALGLGAACKVTAVALLPVLAIAAVAGARRRGGGRAWATRSVILLTLAVFVAFVAFRVAQPYAFDTPTFASAGLSGLRLNDRWVQDQETQDRLLSGEASFPPSVQWIGRDSYVFPFLQMTRWGMGPALAIAGWGGVLLAGWRLIARREALHLLPLAFVVLYFGFMGGQFSLYLRYFLPLYPVLAVFAAYLAVEAASRARDLARRRRLPALETAGYAPAALLLLVTALWGIAYLSVYSRPVTRVEASRWFHENVPPGTGIAVEHWDETVPLRLPHQPSRDFRIVQINLYEPDSPQKFKSLFDALDQAEYLVLSSNRLLVSIPRNPINYPSTARYYELLLAEGLGFRRYLEFTSYPGVLGLELRDHDTEESWSSYDHPRVLVFRKSPDYSRERVEALFDGGPYALANLTPAQADKNALLLRPADLATQRAGGTWTDIFPAGGFAVEQPFLLWLIVLEAAAFAVLPATLLLFRRLPDAGHLLAKPLGLLSLAYPVWLLTSLKLIDFSRGTIFATLVALIVLGSVLSVRYASEIAASLKRRWPVVLLGEALFLGALLAFYELRLINPDLWHSHLGGEKPMDLAYLTAVTRSTTLPPYDPWFAGGYINYYYLGHFFTATLVKLTGIRPEVAFNLAIPTFFALTAGVAFSVAYNLAAATRARLRRRPGLRPLPAWSPAAVGLLGAVFVVVVGNLDGVGQLVDRLSAVMETRVTSPVPLVAPVVNSVRGLWEVVVNGADLAPFDFWRSSRMLKSDPPGFEITEFPYFSFLYADLHAHVMALPFAIAAIGACLALALGRAGERRAWREWLVVALLGLLVGSLRWLNSWDYPPYLLLGLAAIVIGERRLEGGPAAAVARVALKGAVLVGASVLLFLPFLRSYDQPVSGLEPTPTTTHLDQYLAHFGLFLAAAFAFLLFLLLRSLRRSPLPSLGVALRRGGPRGLLWAYNRLPSRDLAWTSLLATALGLLAVAAAYFALRGDTATAALVPALALVAYLAQGELRRQRPDSGPRLMALTLLGLALGLSLAVEFVRIEGDIARMNTVFKFYLHVWVLLALFSAYAVWQLLFIAWSPAPRTEEGLVRHLPRFAGGFALGALLIGALIYTVAATPVRLDNRFLDLPNTEDGAAYMRAATYYDAKGPIVLSYDYEGIQWLRANVQGSPAIVEGRTPLYRWGGRFSIYTGLPTVLGWDWHQVQQRGQFAFMVDQRAREVERFYNDPDPVQAVLFLKQYDVRYVVVGQLERLYYAREGLAKFPGGLGNVLEPAYENDALTIYRVRTDRLPGAPLVLP